MTKKVYTLGAFLQLSESMQLELLHKDGVYVGKRLVDGQDVLLFQLYSFYAEVVYREYRREVDRLIISDSIEMVHPYLDQIRLRGLDGDAGGGGNQ